MTSVGCMRWRRVLTPYESLERISWDTRLVRCYYLNPSFITAFSRGKISLATLKIEGRTYQIGQLFYDAQLRYIKFIRQRTL